MTARPAPDREPRPRHHGGPIDAAGDLATAPEPEGVRMDLVRRLRREIRQGTYATPERFQAAVARLARALR